MTARPVSTEPLISMAEVADRLGVPLKTFRRWRLHNQAPQGYQLGRQIKFRWSEVETWLQARREPARHLTAVAPLGPRGDSASRRRNTRTATN